MVIDPKHLLPFSHYFHFRDTTKQKKKRKKKMGMAAILLNLHHFHASFFLFLSLIINGSLRRKCCTNLVFSSLFQIISCLLK